MNADGRYIDTRLENLPELFSAGPTQSLSSDASDSLSCSVLSWQGAGLVT